MNSYADLHSFIVDPQRDGVDNALWKAVTGTLAVSGNKFRFNASEGLVRSDILFGRIEIPVTFPLSATNDIDAAVFTGAGLDDLTAGGAYEGGLVTATYVVTVSTAAATDKFTWSKNGGTASEEISMTGSAQELEQGVTVTFAATTGHTKGEYWTINVTVNDVADLVNDIEFGLKNLALGTKSKIQLLADKSEGTLTFNTYDRNGTVQTTTITWQGAWNSAVTRFVIDWFNDRIVLSVINASSTTEVVLATHKTRVGQHPLNPYVKVTGVENLDVDYISIERTKSSSIMLI